MIALKSSLRTIMESEQKQFQEELDKRRKILDDQQTKVVGLDVETAAAAAVYPNVQPQQPNEPKSAPAGRR